LVVEKDAKKAVVMAAVKVALSAGESVGAMVV